LKFIGESMKTFTAQIICALLGMVSTIIIAHTLGPSGKGAYSLIILFPTMLGQLGTLGIQIANANFAGSKRYKIGDLASNSLIAALGLGIILPLGFLFYMLYQPSVIADANPQFIMIALLAVPFLLLRLYFGYLLLGGQKINQYNFLPVFQVSLAVLILLVVLLGLGMGLLATIITWVLANVAAGILSILLVKRLVNIKWSFHPRLFGDSVRFGIQGYLGLVAYSLNFQLATLLLAFFMNTTSIGYYSVALNVASLLSFFPAAVGVVIFTRVVGMSAKEANITTPQVCRNTLFITILAAVIVFALSKYIIILLYGESFLPALHSLWILLGGMVAFSIFGVLGNELAGRGRPIVLFIAYAAALAVNVLLSLWLIPLWGLNGAALATAISYFVAAIVGLIWFLRISGNTLTNTLFPRREDINLYTGIITRLWKWSFSQMMRIKDHQ